MKVQTRRNLFYAAMQGINWMLVCTIMGFASTWLIGRGLSASQTGLIMALGNLLSLIVEPILASLADKSDRYNSARIMTVLVLVTALSSIVMLNSTISLTIASAAILLSIAAITMGMSFVTSIMFLLEDQNVQINFGTARAVGSVMYALISALMGVQVSKRGIQVIPLFTLVLSLIFLVFLLYTDRHYHHQNTVNQTEAAAGSYKNLFASHHGYLRLVAGMVLIWFAFTLNNNFLNLVVSNAGGTSRDMGHLMSFMAVLELPVMMISARLFDKFTISRTLAFSIIMFSVREILFASASSVPALYFASFFQCMSYALYTPASVAYAQKLASRNEKVKAQAALNLANTIASIFSSFFGGMLYDTLGASYTLWIGALVSVIGTVIAVSGIQKE